MSKLALPDAVRMIREEEPKTLSSIQRSLRGDVETIVAKALAKEKKRRFASAAEFAADIRRYLAHEPIAARPASARYQLAKFARRNKAVFAGVAAVFLTLVIGTATTTWQAIRAKRQTANAIASQIAAKAAEDEVRRQLRRISDLAGEFLKQDIELAHLPENTKVRRSLVLASSSYLNAVANAAPDDLEIEQNFMIAYRYVCDVQNTLDAENHADVAAALESAGKGMEIANRLIAAQPHNLRVAIEKAAFYHVMGNAYCRLGRTKKATGTLQEGITFTEALLNDHENDMSLRFELSCQYRSMGEILQGQGQYEKSLEFLSRAKGIADDFDRIQHHGGSRLAIATILSDMAFAELYLKRLDAAYVNCQLGLKLLRSDAEANPGHPQLQHAIWQLRDLSARAQAASGQVYQAYEDYPECLRLAKNLARDEQNVQAQFSLAASYATFGTISLAAGDFGESIRLMADGRDIFARLARRS